MKALHEMRMNWTEINMIKWICGSQLNERKKSEELRMESAIIQFYAKVARSGSISGIVV